MYHRIAPIGRGAQEGRALCRTVRHRDEIKLALVGIAVRQDFGSMLSVTPSKYDIVTQRVQSPYDMASEKAGSSGNENAHLSRP